MHVLLLNHVNFVAIFLYDKSQVIHCQIRGLRTLWAQIVYKCPPIVKLCFPVLPKCGSACFAHNELFLSRTNVKFLKMPWTKQVAKKSKMEKFASLDAKTRFEELYCEKQYLSDLGFIWNGEAPYPLPSECQDMIRALNWEKFCNQRIEPDLSIVREFYANLWPNNVYFVFVRERQVPLNPRAINQLSDLHHYNNDVDEYFSLFSNHGACVSFSLHCERKVNQCG